METTLLWFLKLIAGLAFLAPFLELFPLFVFVFALRRVRIDSSRTGEVYLLGVDPWTMLIFIVGGSAVCVALFLSAGFLAAAAGAFASLLLAWGCRIEIWVTPMGSRITRRIFGILPWSVWHSPSAPTLYLDGWGDMMDPEALHVGFGLGDLELGWSDANFAGCAEELVAEFKGAVGALRG